MGIFGSIKTTFESVARGAFGITTSMDAGSTELVGNAAAIAKGMLQPETVANAAQDYVKAVMDPEGFVAGASTTSPSYGIAVSNVNEAIQALGVTVTRDELQKAVQMGEGVYNDTSRAIQETQEYEENGLVRVNPMPDDSSRAYVLYDPSTKTTTIAFRGTWDPNDAINDLKFQPENLPGGGQVHSGYSQAYQEIDMEKVLAAIPPEAERVITTGHSLGGTLAQFAALEIHEKRPDLKINIIPVATPKVGDKAFAQRVEAASSNVINVVAEKDPVPYANVDSNLVRAGSAIILQDNGEIVPVGRANDLDSSGFSAAALVAASGAKDLTHGVIHYARSIEFNNASYDIRLAEARGQAETMLASAPMPSTQGEQGPSQAPPSTQRTTTALTFNR